MHAPLKTQKNGKFGKLSDFPVCLIFFDAFLLGGVAEYLAISSRIIMLCSARQATSNRAHVRRAVFHTTQAITWKAGACGAWGSVGPVGPGSDSMLGHAGFQA